MRTTLMLTILLFIPTAGHSDVILVPGEYPTIQEAIQAAKEFDLILVAPGVYLENLDFGGKPVTVRSDVDGDPETHDLSPASTVIDGNQQGSVVLFQSQEDEDSIIEGFTLTNGSGTLHDPEDATGGNPPPGGSGDSGSSYYGGGLFCRSAASPTIRENIIHDNMADFGGGIACDDSSQAIISKNDISGNKAYNGGGIQCRNFSNPQIIGNLISGNVAKVVDGYGGGIACTEEAYPTIRDNLIQGNEAGYFGGGIYCSNGEPYIINNVIVNNFVSYNAPGGWSFGGGIFFGSGEASPELVNNTISSNSARKGGGIFCWYDIHPLVVNTILWGNMAYDGKEIYLDKHLTPCGLSISFSNVEGGLGSVFVESGSNLVWDAASIIVEDPGFLDPGDGDFHLSWISSCVNRGTNENTPDVDIDGDPRPEMGTTDIGADELTGVHPFEANTFSLSESSGGAVSFLLHGGAGNAGRDYLIFGTASGTVPGTPLPGGDAILPVNWDQFTNIVGNLNYPDSIVFVNFYGPLDANGNATAEFKAQRFVPEMIGLTLSFAYPLDGPPWDFVSNPVNIEVVP